MCNLLPVVKPPPVMKILKVYFTAWEGSMSIHRLSTISPIPALKILQCFVSLALSSLPLPNFNNLLSIAFLACLTLCQVLFLTILLDKVMKRTWPLNDTRVGPKQWKAPHSFPCPWNFCSVHCSQSGSYFPNAALGDQTCFESIWMVYMTEAH